jgi:SHS2 domain-containing protein
MHWEHFGHVADIGVRGVGATRAEAFEQAALALTAVVAEPGEIAADEAITIQVEAPDDELLLVDWLNAIVYEVATTRLLFGRFAVKLDGHRLEATAWGEPVDRARHRPAVEVKAATCSELSVRKQEDGRWIAQCVVDV